MIGTDLSINSHATAAFHEGRFAGVVISMDDLRQRAQAGKEKAHLAREFGISRETVCQYIRSES